MKIIYTRAVTKDVRKIKDQKVITRITKVLDELKQAESLEETTSIKKLAGHPTAYRIRIGTYRLGFYYENDTVILARFLKRSDIYQVFPS